MQTLSRPSFDEYVTARSGTLLRFAYLICGDRHLAEDLVQEVLIKAHRRWDAIETDNPDAYLRRAIVRTHVSWLRRRSSSEIATDTLREDSTGDGFDDAHASREAVWAMLAKLPRAQRAVLVLRYFEDLDDARIAELVGVSASTVRTHAHRGLATLRETLQEQAAQAPTGAGMLETVHRGAARAATRRRALVAGGLAALVTLAALILPLALRANRADTPPINPTPSTSASPTSSPTSAPDPLANYAWPVPDGPPVPDAAAALIYFESTEDLSMSAMTLTADGSGPHRHSLSAFGSISYLNRTSVDFSRDGQWIAFGHGVTGNLMIARTDGMGLVDSAIPLLGSCGPAWSPDSRMVAFVTGVPDTDARVVEIINADGTGRRTLDAQGGCWPTWSADGSLLSYIRDGQMVTIRPDGTGRRVVPADLPADTAVRTVMSISPDGRAVVGLDKTSGCGCDDGERRHNLIDPQILDVDTGSLTPLTDPRGSVDAGYFRSDGSLVLLVRTSEEFGLPLTVVVRDPQGDQVSSWVSPLPYFPIGVREPS